jgi:hypothetical protein
MPDSEAAYRSSGDPKSDHADVPISPASRSVNRHHDKVDDLTLQGMSSPTSLIYLLGSPGVGERTVAEALSVRTGSLVLDNHRINLPIMSVFDWDGSERLPPEVWGYGDRPKVARWAAESRGGYGRSSGGSRRLTGGDELAREQFGNFEPGVGTARARLRAGAKQGGLARSARRVASSARPSGRRQGTVRA